MKKNRLELICEYEICEEKYKFEYDKEFNILWMCQGYDLEWEILTQRLKKYSRNQIWKAIEIEIEKIEILYSICNECENEDGIYMFDDTRLCLECLKKEFFVGKEKGEYC